jgi:hypothetical protein
MRKIFMVLAVVFSTAFGPVLAAAGDTIPSELSEVEKLVLKFAFCNKVCEAEYSFSGICQLNTYNSFEKWYFLQSEVRSILFDRKHKEGFDFNSPLEDKFLKDLEKAQVLDGFVFTEKHAQDCLSEWESMFKDNYTPTFNIELLK